MINVLVFGTGSGAEKLYDKIDFDKVNVVAFVDNNKSKVGKLFQNKSIISADDINKYCFDNIIIASQYYSEIMQQLLDMGISINDIFPIYKSFNEEAIAFNEKVKKFNDNAKKFVKCDYSRVEKSVCGMIRLGRNRRIDLTQTCDAYVNTVDFVRISQIELIADEIYKKNLSGSVAELGVYRGDLSKYINRLFTDRKFYMFDTFEGFDKEDVDFEKLKKFSSAPVGNFGDTSMNIVMSKIKYPENCILKKGYFPNSAQGVNDKFVFISIDVDLYKPTYDGLNFFYDKLVRGGYILIHDYNNNTSFRGVKVAVQKFCFERNISYVPISDFYGSVVICK